jgi:TPR repeat protein
MKKILVILFLFSGLLYADSFDDGMQAYMHTDYQKAAKLFEKAAEQGNIDAQGLLGVMYELGQGVRQNKALAKEYYGKACDNGLEESCDAYSRLNEAGY